MAASSPVLYVSPSGSDQNGRGTAAAPFATIQHAVAVAPPHATVIIEPGTYSGSVTITEPLTLTADATVADATAATVLNASGQTNGITVSGAGASGTTIRHLTIENADNHGILVENANQVTIAGNRVVNNGLNPNKAIAENKPIELVGTADGRVVDNVVTGNHADGGIGLADDGQINPGAAGSGTPAPSRNNLVRGNQIIGNQGGCGVVVAAYNPGQGVWDNQVIDNTVEKNVAGIVVAADPPGTAAVGNLVADNTVRANFIPGIIVHSNAPGQTVSRTTIVDNTIAQNGADPDVKQSRAQTDGIAIIGAVDPVTGTVVSGNHISDQYYGIWMENAAGTLVGGNQSASTVAVPVYTQAGPTPMGGGVSVLWQLTHHPLGYYGAGAIALQQAADIVWAHAPSPSLFALTHHRVGFYGSADIGLQRAADVLWRAGIHSRSQAGTP